MFQNYYCSLRLRTYEKAAVSLSRGDFKPPELGLQGLGGDSEGGHGSSSSSSYVFITGSHKVCMFITVGPMKKL
jgi:hypothetical protein